MLNELSPPTKIDLPALALEIKKWGREFGFQQIGITDIDLDSAERRLNDWLERGFQGDMEYMSRHGDKRSQPAQLIPGTVRVISGRMDYLPEEPTDLRELIDQATGLCGALCAGPRLSQADAQTTRQAGRTYQ